MGVRAYVTDQFGKQHEFGYVHPLFPYLFGEKLDAESIGGSRNFAHTELVAFAGRLEDLFGTPDLSQLMLRLGYAIDLHQQAGTWMADELGQSGTLITMAQNALNALATPLLSSGLDVLEAYKLLCVYETLCDVIYGRQNHDDIFVIQWS